MESKEETKNLPNDWQNKYLPVVNDILKNIDWLKGEFEKQARDMDKAYRDAELSNPKDDIDTYRENARLYFHKYEQTIMLREAFTTIAIKIFESKELDPIDK